MDPELEHVYKVMKDISILKSISTLLDWDENTNMPGSALHGRSEQVKLIEGLIYEKLISPRLKSSIKKLKSNKLTSNDTIILAELETEALKAERYPPAHRRNLAKNLVLARNSWKTARKANDFSKFSPALRKVVQLRREQALMLNPVKNAYDTLIQEYEPGMTAERYDEIFSYMKPKLLELLEKIKSSKRYKEQQPLDLKIEKKEQREIINDFVKMMGITPERVKISTSLHAFTASISRNDVRITTRYTDPLESFFTALHEAGHALYSMNLPKRFYHTFVYNQASFGLDEAQAMLWEYQIGKSPMLWQNYYLTYRKHMGKVTRWKDFYDHINMVRPSFIRVTADEVTFCLHVILRYEIEKELINGSLKVEQVKEKWNSMMQDLLGILPRRDNEGALQDIHWAAGDFGYFPSYAIGAIYSAQIARQMYKDIKGSEKLVQAQDFAPFIEWLRKGIYLKGKTRTAEQLVRSVTGSGLNPRVFVQYLYEKYSKIYGF